MTATVAGSPWQEVLGHRVELSEPPAATVGGPGVWDSALWDSEQWGAGWAPTFHDVTANLLDAHATLGATGLDVSAGIGVIELDLLDLGGAYSPGGSVDWLLGRHVRGWLSPAGMGELPGFYGIVDKAEAGGSFAVPTVQITAYDVRALVAPVVTAAPVADAPQRADERLVAILDAAGFPPELVLVEEDTTPLLADDTLDLGDLLDRTAESSAGLVWGDSSGRIRTRNRGWVHGSPDGAAVELYVYAGTPPTVLAGAVVAQTTDLGSSESLGTVRNHVTYSNRAEPPVAVVAVDVASSRRYGWRKHTVTDLACDEALLDELAERDVELHATPFRVCEGATVTVYDEATAAAAAVELGDVVTVGRYDPGVDEWELAGIVTGIELTFDASRFTVALTVVDTGTIILGGPGRWDSATWDGNRWSSVPVSVFALGPSDRDTLDSGHSLG